MVNFQQVYLCLYFSYIGSITMQYLYEIAIFFPERGAGVWINRWYKLLEILWRTSIPFLVSLLCHRHTAALVIFQVHLISVQASLPAAVSQLPWLPGVCPWHHIVSVTLHSPTTRTIHLRSALWLVDCYHGASVNKPLTSNVLFAYPFCPCVCYTMCIVWGNVWVSPAIYLGYLEFWLHTGKLLFLFLDLLH